MKKSARRAANNPAPTRKPMEMKIFTTEAMYAAKFSVRRAWS